MIDDIIQKQVEEFQSEFINDHDRVNGPRFLRGIFVEDVEAHLRSSMKKVGEEIAKRLQEEFANVTMTDPDNIDYACKALDIDDWNVLISSLTDKGE